MKDDRFIEGGEYDGDISDLSGEDLFDKGVRDMNARRRKPENTVLHKQNRQQNEKQNKEILRVAYFFVLLFVAVIGYMVYFNVAEAESLASSPQNALIQKFTETVVKGEILSADGKVLACTVTDESGDETRQYPYANMFAHVVGTATVNKSGLEATQEYQLLKSSQSPLSQAVNEYKGEKSIGNNVITTLDTRLQKAAYDALGNNDGVVICIEPSTGKIKCMVSKPDYDPNTLANDYVDIVSVDGAKNLLNQATNGLFTPGSIFKIFTTIEYIRENGIQNDYSYTCNGKISLANSTLSCYGGEKHGTVDVKGSFVHSCNTSYSNMGLSLNKQRFAETCNSLLFNTKLPTDIGSVKSSFTLSPSADDWTCGATAIGQGDTMISPLHAVMVTSAIANGGLLMKPYLVDSITDADGKLVNKIMPESYGRLMSTEESDYMAALMREVVTSGTAKGLKNVGFAVSGKTGTAEVAGSGNNAWFVGYISEAGKDLAICVLVEDASRSSAYVAVPVASKVLSAYYNIK